MAQIGHFGIGPIGAYGGVLSGVEHRLVVHLGKVHTTSVAGVIVRTAYIWRPYKEF